MTRKLERHQSTEIIHRALGGIRPSGDLSPDETLGNLMPSPVEREKFRHTVTRLAKEQAFEIDSAAIPVFPHTKIKDVAEALSDLAGDIYTTKPHDPSPAPPTPKGDKPKYPGPRTKHEESR